MQRRENTQAACLGIQIGCLGIGLKNASWMPRHPKRMLQHTGGGRVRDGDTRTECRGIQNGCRGMRGQRRNPEASKMDA